MIDMGMTDHLVRLDHVSLVALAFVVVIGLPHGAFDGAIARHLGYARTLGGLIKFITVYLGLRRRWWRSGCGNRGWHWHYFC